MNEQTAFVYVCPMCGTSLLSYGPCKCSRCRSETIKSSITAEQWNSMNDQEKIKSKSAVLEGWSKLSSQEKSAINPAAAASSSANGYTYGQKESVSSSMWVSVLRGVAWAVIIIGILASIIGGVTLMSRQGLLGLVVIILGCAVSVLSVAGIMVFLDMADDLRTIRSLVERNNKEK